MFVYRLLELNSVLVYLIGRQILHDQCYCYPLQLHLVADLPVQPTTKQIKRQIRNLYIVIVEIRNPLFFDMS